MLTTAQVADRLGVSTRRVLAIAENRGVKPAMVVGAAFLWARDAVKLLRPGRRGRPKKT